MSRGEIGGLIYAKKCHVLYEWPFTDRDSLIFSCEMYYKTLSWKKFTFFLEKMIIFRLTLECQMDHSWIYLKLFIRKKVINWKMSKNKNKLFLFILRNLSSWQTPLKPAFTATTNFLLTLFFSFSDYF